MNILIYKDEQQLGPYSPEDIDIQLKSGTLALEDLAWVDGEDDWKPLREILARRGPGRSGAAFAADDGQSPGDSEEEPPSLRDRIESLLGKAQASALLTQKQAQRKMIELVDLRPAYQQLGRKAYESGRLPSRYAAFVSPIDRLRAEIESLQEQKGAAGAAAVAKIQGLTLKLNQLFANLGDSLREDGLGDPSVKHEMELANKAFASVTAMDGEISELSSKAYPWARRPLLIAAVVAGALLLYFGLGKMRAAYSGQAPAAETRTVEAQAAANGQTRGVSA